MKKQNKENITVSELVNFAIAKNLMACPVEDVVFAHKVDKALLEASVMHYDTNIVDSVIAILNGGNFLYKEKDCHISGNGWDYRGIGYLVIFHEDGYGCALSYQEPFEEVMDILTEKDYLELKDRVQETISMLQDCEDLPF